MRASTARASATPHGSGEKWHEVWLIANREITTRIRSKSFLILSAVMVLAVIVAAVVAGIASGSDSATKLGVTGPVASLSQTITSVAKASDDDIQVTTVSSEDAGRAQVKDGTLDALLTGTPGSPELLVKQDADAQLVTELNQVTQQTALAGQISALGGDPAAVQKSVAGASVKVVPLDPQHINLDQMLIGLLTGILITMALVLTGQLVAQGVVEEKTSRVIELLLATARPWQVMAGKVLGIGFVGLAQVVLIVVAGLVASAATGLLGSVSVSLGAAALSLVVWFVIGYITYATVMAALAALVSRQEEVSAVLTPVTVLMMIPYLIGVTVLPSNPTSPVVAVLSMIPFFSPLLMPIRISTGVADGWQVAVSLVLAIALIPVLVRLAGAIYGRAVLRTGSRVKLGEALRKA